MTTVAHFEIGYTQFVDPQGEPTQPLPAFAREPAALIALYRAMVSARAFDAKAIALQRTGKIGTFASALGQEAVGVGVASAMRPEDVLVPSYRDHPAQFLRGVTMTESLLYWGGDERGRQGRGEEIERVRGTTLPTACRSRRRSAMRWVRRTPSSCGARRAPRCACWATAEHPVAISTKV